MLPTAYRNTRRLKVFRYSKQELRDFSVAIINILFQLRCEGGHIESSLNDMPFMYVLCPWLCYMYLNVNKRDFCCYKLCLAVNRKVIWRTLNLLDLVLFILWLIVQVYLGMLINKYECVLSSSISTAKGNSCVS